MSQKFTGLLLAGVVAVGIGFIYQREIFWGTLRLALVMGWVEWPQTQKYEPWDGCVDPTSEAERDAWVAHAKATGEPLCDPKIVEMEFPEYPPSPKS